MIETELLILVAIACFVVIAALILTLRSAPRVPWLTLASILLLLIAGAGVLVRAETAGRSLTVLDVSWSMGGDTTGPSTPAGDATRLVVFGRRAVLQGDGPVPSDRVRSAADEDGSDLAAALRIAAGEVGPGGVVTVVTDGRVEVEGLDAAAAAVHAAGATIQVFPGGRRQAGDALVTSLRLPGRVSESAGVTVLATVEGTPGSAARVRLLVDGVEVQAQTAPFGVSGRSGVRFDLPPLAAGRHEISVAVVPPAGDPCPMNDRRSSGLVVHGARRAGLVNADGLKPTLAAAGWEIVAGWPGKHPDLDLLVVRDVAVTRFVDRGEAVRKYVEAGGGLLVAGGTKCFGPGGWGGTPLEACLPVLSHPGDDGIFVAFLLDRSGTMAEPFRGGGGAKFDAARRATESLVALLPEGSDLLLIPFAGEVLGQPSILRVTDAAARAAARESLERAGRPSGGTVLAAPLARARDALRTITAEKRLVLLFTDGRLEGETPESVRAAAESLRSAGARIVCFAVGEDADRSLLDDLSGPGRSAVPVTEDGQVREGFIDALFELQGEDRIMRGDHAVTATGRPGLPLVSVPTVGEYVRTWARGDGTVWHLTDDDSPVTAGRRYGLGRSVVVTSDLSSMPGALTAALIEAAARPASVASARFETSIDRGRTTVTAALPVDAEAVSGWLTDAAGGRHPVTLFATGSNSFGASLPRLPPGAAWFDIAATDGTPIRAGGSVPWPSEYRSSGPDAGALGQLAARLGRPASDRHRGTKDASPALACLALLLFLADRLKRRGGQVR